VITRGLLLEHVWDDSADPLSNSIETHVTNIRKKIDRGGRRKLIHTLPGRGYIMGSS
jgi:two-component system OmpR family response regulator